MPFIIFIYLKLFKFLYSKYFVKVLNKWGLGIGDWGLGIGDWGLGPNPHPPLPIPQPPPPTSQIIIV